MKKKKCVLCKKVIVINYRTTKERLKRKKYCSRGCQGRSIGGWNKGKKMNLSDEVRRNIGNAIRERILNETKKQRKKRMANVMVSRKKNGIWQPASKFKVGEKSEFWLGEKASYNSKHKWIQKHWTKKEICELCGAKPKPRPETRLKVATQWANVSKKYFRDREDWLELCPKCHKNYDKN